MQALILAAGRGSRLGGKGFDLPKCLLEIGRRPLIEHQLESLAEAGVGPVGMVLGYCADEIQEIVGIRAEYILNPRWNVTNSLYSFWLAREWVKGPILILNCDILFHPEILDRLLATEGDVIAYDSSSGEGREHMKVKVRDDWLVSMSKELPAAEAAGENLGILSLTADTAQALFGQAEELIAAEGEKLWLGSAVCRIAKERVIRVVDVAGLPWGEIDFPYDLDRVRKEVLPAIRRTARRRNSLWRLTRQIAAMALIALLVFSAFRAWVSPTTLTWETADIDNIERVKILGEDQSQTWFLLAGEQTAETQVQGPTRLRIDSRIILPTSDSGEVPYVLGVQLDGQRLGWFKEIGKPSRTWSHAQWALAKRERITLDVPPGQHRLGIRLVASDSGSCLIRVRQEVAEEAEE